MASRDEITQLLAEIDTIPWGQVEREMTARAIAMAVELGDLDLEYQARMRQSASANQGGDTDLLLSSFAWCLAMHDSDPARFPADINNGSADLMWHFKWMASTLRASPEFTAEQIAAVLDDMEAHYREEGLGLSGVAMARFEDAWGAGRMDEAEERRVMLEATPRDSHSHCDACGRSQLVGYFAQTGRDEDALRLVEEMIQGGFSCGEEPEHAMSRSLLPYLRAGRTDDAKRAHMRSYRLAKDNPDNLAMIAMNIVFATVTGNEARALAMIERHISWLAHDALNAAGQVVALRSFGLALDAVAAAGHGDTVVRGADASNLTDFFGEHTGTWNARDLAAAAWIAAERIGTRFDARNSTTAFADALARDRALASFRVEVPIKSDAFVTDVAPAAPQTSEERYRRAINLGDWGDGDAALTAIELALSDNIAEHAADLHGLLVGGYIAVGQSAKAIQHLTLCAQTRRDEGKTELADIIDELGLSLFGVSEDDSVPPTAVIEKLTQALNRTSGLESRGTILGGLASAYLAAGAFAESIEMAQAAHTEFVAHGDENDITDALVMVSYFAGIAGDAELSQAAANEALTSPALSQGQRATLLESRGRALGGAGDFAAGAADADTALQILTGIGATMGIARLCTLAGALLEDAGEPGEAGLRYRVAVRQLERDGEVTTAVRFRLAHALVLSGAASEAIEVLSGVYADENEAGVEAASRAETIALLAEAFEADDQAGGAVSAWGHAADLHAEAENSAGRAHSLMMQGRILSQYGEHTDAIELLELAVSLSREDPENVALIARALHLLGQAYGATGDERAIVAFDETERLARENDAAWLVADVTDSRARALAATGNIDRAIGLALQAADAFAGEGDILSAAGSELFAGRLLAGAERSTDAVSIYQSLMSRPIQGTPVHQVGAIELGDLYAGLGRHAEAAAVRALIQE